MVAEGRRYRRTYAVQFLVVERRHPYWRLCTETFDGRGGRFGADAFANLCAEAGHVVLGVTSQLAEVTP